MIVISIYQLIEQLLPHQVILGKWLGIAVRTRSIIIRWLFHYLVVIEGCHIVHWRLVLKGLWRSDEASSLDRWRLREAGKLAWNMTRSNTLRNLSNRLLRLCWWLHLCILVCLRSLRLSRRSHRLVSAIIVHYSLHLRNSRDLLRLVISSCIRVHWSLISIV